MTRSGASPPEMLARPLESLPDPLPVRPLRLPAPPGRHHSVTIRPPGSKSLTNRLLVLAGLARGVSILRGVPDAADDVDRMIHAIEALGAGVELPREGEVRIHGTGGRWRASPGGVTLDLGNAGTAARFLAGTSLLADGPVTIDGNQRMRERPIGELCELLEALGARTEPLASAGSPPIRITPPREPAGGRCLEVPTTASSQFVSALLLAAPFIAGGLTLRFTGELTSRSYVEMTIGLLARLGAAVRSSEGLRVIRVGPPAEGTAGAGLSAFETTIEPDASGGTYFWGAGALVPGLACRVEGVGAASLQGDGAFPHVLARMGADVEARGEEGPISCAHRGPLSPILIDMRDMPDAAVTLSVVCAFASGPSVLRGLSTLRVKECDRIEALRTELARIGVRVEPGVQGDGGAMTITPPPGGIDCSDSASEVVFDTYEDHRMAMALSLVGLRRPNVSIRDPTCVAKTYPTYWRDLARLYEAVSDG